jgi:hypothetical protein
VKVLSLVGIVLILSIGVRAVDEQTAQSAYCKYVMEEASAQRDLLRSPIVIAGPTQPSGGTPPEMVFGLTYSIADVRKASLSMKAASAACGLYGSATSAQEHVHFATALIEKDALMHRLDLIQQAAEKLQALEREEEKVVEAQNLTRRATYYLEAASARLDMSRTSALTELMGTFVPELNDVPIRVLVGNKERGDQAYQRAQANLAKESGWDLKVAAGGRQQLGQFNSSATISELGAFGEFTLSYNLGRHAANNHVEKSVPAFMAWKAAQFDDVAQQSADLRRQFEDTATVLRQQLKVLLQHDSDLDKALKSLDGLDSSNALTFRDQLRADQLVLRVDIGDMQYRLDLLDGYVRKNF